MVETIIGRCTELFETSFFEIFNLHYYRKFELRNHLNDYFVNLHVNFEIKSKKLLFIFLNRIIWIDLIGDNSKKRLNFIDFISSIKYYSNFIKIYSKFLITINHTIFPDRSLFFPQFLYSESKEIIGSNFRDQRFLSIEFPIH